MPYVDFFQEHQYFSPLNTVKLFTGTEGNNILYNGCGLDLDPIGNFYFLCEEWDEAEEFPVSFMVKIREEIFTSTSGILLYPMISSREITLVNEEPNASSGAIWIARDVPIGQRTYTQQEQDLENGNAVTWQTTRTQEIGMTIYFGFLGGKAGSSPTISGSSSCLLTSRITFNVLSTVSSSTFGTKHTGGGLGTQCDPGTFGMEYDEFYVLDNTIGPPYKIIDAGFPYAGLSRQTLIDVPDNNIVKRLFFPAVFTGDPSFSMAQNITAIRTYETGDGGFDNGCRNVFFNVDGYYGEYSVPPWRLWDSSSKNAEYRGSVVFEVVR